MRTKSIFLALGVCLLLLGSHAASAQVSVTIGGGYYPPYYGPRYYPPRPPVVYAVPPPVMVAPAPAPYYYAPRPVYYAPRPIYGYRGGYRGRGYGRRW
ncbi:hypothetical protein [Hymenobacter rubidus]|uniref:hypothetical protein n=1 Tax=Hymenobacter rubidus TaxID=1441626 RepID=UPI001F2EAAF0|nr:hypothetical protein [Hymenobacter rubidus]